MNIWELLSLKGKVLLVSGGAGNYGKCICEGLAEAGGTVVIASRNWDKCKTVADDFRAKGLDVHAMKVEQSDHDSILCLKNGLLKTFGKLDVFVNNSVARPMKSYGSLPK
ncbi:MAG: SDR family NAD(P)-dependent oxidoreductase [Planctomycetaceae bacterium]|nr:SDR family NAD(P)-dependent oxidoreductase [Planctomycetaceae bacterium]